jgi:hypothetical protein
VTAKHSPAFVTGLKSIIQGDILVPVLRAYLSSPEFRTIEVKVQVGGRKPDYWFHPSSHPEWTPRALWLWMVAPQLLEEEPLDPASLLSMTAGSVWHAIITKAMLDLDLLLAREVKFEDPETKSRGSADGLLKSGLELFEFKTAKDVRVRKLDDIPDFIEMYPGYYLQALEYMRLSGIHFMRFLVMALTYPFEMREFVIPYDHILASQTADKYRLVNQNVADGDVPICSACPKKIFCPARAVCESATYEQIRSWIGKPHGV